MGPKISWNASISNIVVKWANKYKVVFVLYVINIT